MTPPGIEPSNPLERIAESLVILAYAAGQMADALERVARWCDDNPAVYLKRLYGATPPRSVEAAATEETAEAVNGDVAQTLVVDLNLDCRNSVRIYNCLHKAGIKTVGQLLEKSEAEMLRMQNFGAACLVELKEQLATRGLHFRSRA